MFLGRNGLIHTILILTTILLCANNLLYLMIYPLFMLVSDVLYYGFHIKIFDPEERIERGYEFSAIYTDAAYGDGLDLGFNLYDGNFDKSRDQAQKDKWDFLIEKLQLKPGMVLCDVGCGYGDWLNYARSQGIETIGINISKTQTDIGLSRGLNVINSNWKDVLDQHECRELLIGKVDAVTFMDTIEHYVPAQHRINRDEQNKIYTKMFEFASQLLKDESPSRRIFVSCLHYRYGSNRNFSAYVVNYFLDKYHSGSYPVFEIDQLVVNANNIELKLLGRWNKTIDYFKTSILDPEHFGIQQMHWNFRRLMFVFYFMIVDPDWFHKWIYRSQVNWMKQFDENEIAESPMQLLWLLFQK